MGLAAAQARLLTLTARKSDCEFQSMQLSHQKIAMARDMEKISQEYQNALNNTSLVYDYYGSGAKEMNLSYGLLMTPSIYNDYYPKLLTDTQNRVVLNGAMAAAAKYAGIPAEGLNGTPSSDVRDTFIEGLYNAGAISLTTGNNILNTNYGNTIGLGDMVTVNTYIEDVDYNTLLGLIKDNTVSTGDYGFTLGLQNNVLDATISVVDNGAAGNTTAFSAKTYEMVWEKSKSSSKAQIIGYDYDTQMYTDVKQRANTKNVDVNLYDLLTNETDYSLVMMSPVGYYGPFNEMAYMQTQLVGNSDDASFLNWLTDQFLNVLGSTEQNQMAVQYAYDTVRNIIYPNDDIINTASKVQSDLQRMLTMRPKASDVGQPTTTYISNTQQSVVTDSNGNKTTNYVGLWTSEERTAIYRNVASYLYGNAVVHDPNDEGRWSDTEKTVYYADNTLNGKKYSDIIAEAGTFISSCSYGRSCSRGYCFNGLNTKQVTSVAPNTDHKTQTQNAYTLGSAATNNIGLVYFADGNGTASGAAVNLNNLAKVFLTAIVDYNEQMQNGYSYKKGGNLKGLYDGKDDDTPFNIAYSDADQANGNLDAHFYDALLNQICVNGWTMNSNVDDSGYMQEMLKNGMMYISSITEDGLYLQENYANDKYINEKTNSEEVARAEAKYNTEKAKIENKEQRLDMKLKRLDAEISSISTEYDSVKNLIKTNIDKGFKRYDA